MQFISEIEVADLQTLLSETNKKIQLIDVRNPEEVAKGAIPGAVNLPFQIIPRQLNRLSKDKTVILYCGLGKNSAEACSYLEERGYANTHSLRGGFEAWSICGLRVI